MVDNDKIHYAMPVSYTHLDVYKRQMYVDKCAQATCSVMNGFYIEDRANILSCEVCTFWITIGLKFWLVLISLP